MDSPKYRYLEHRSEFEPGFWTVEDLLYTIPIRYQFTPGDCPRPHRPPEGPNEDTGHCSGCGSLAFEMRPQSETYGDHLPDCSLPRYHESYCVDGGEGHPRAEKIRGYWPDVPEDLEED